MPGIKQFEQFTIPPADLGSDAAGPFWMFRRGAQAIVADLTGWTASYSIDPNPRLPLSFVAGSRLPLYMRDGHVWAGTENLTASLGRRPWENYAAARTGQHILLRAFHVDAPPVRASSWVVLVGPGGWVQEDPAPFFEARAAVGGGRVAFVRRLNRGLEVESAAESLLLGGWNPDREQADAAGKGRARGLFYGDPVVTVEDDGEAHWAACLWQRTRDRGPDGTRRDYSHQLPQVFVDGKRVVSDAAVASVGAGSTTPAKLQWVPALCWAPSLGLCLGWQSKLPGGRDPGEVTVALLRPDGRLVGRRTLPGFQPLLEPVVGQGKVWTATSHGVWGPA